MIRFWVIVFLMWVVAPVGAQTWEEVKPVLVNACFACHASKLAPAPQPAVSISTEKKRRKEIRRGEASFLMGEEFPFPGADSPKKQAGAMKFMISTGKMPPNGRRNLGLGSVLKSADRKILMDWLRTKTGK